MCNSRLRLADSAVDTCSERPGCVRGFRRLRGGGGTAWRGRDGRGDASRRRCAGPVPVNSRGRRDLGNLHDDQSCAAAAAVLLSAGVAPAAAQAVEATRPDAPLLRRPAAVVPCFHVRDIGIDSNVYNDSQVLREDFTYTVSPMLRAVLPIGASRLTTRGGLDFRYFQRLKDQQSTSGWLNAQLEIGSGRVRPFGAAGLVRSHERGGYDVDTRALSVATQARVGASVALTPVTSLTGWVVRETTRFPAVNEFDGVAAGRAARPGDAGHRHRAAVRSRRRSPRSPRPSRSRRCASHMCRFATPTASASRRWCSSPRAPSSRVRRRPASVTSGRSTRGWHRTAASWHR